MITELKHTTHGEDGNQGPTRRSLEFPGSARVRFSDDGAGGAREDPTFLTDPSCGWPRGGTKVNNQHPTGQPAGSHEPVQHQLYTPTRDGANGMANSNVTANPIVLERPYTNMKEYDASDQAGFKHLRIRLANLSKYADSRICSFSRLGGKAEMNHSSQRWEHQSRGRGVRA